MARKYTNPDDEDHGKLILEEVFPNCVEVFYVPSVTKLNQSSLNAEKPDDYRVSLLLINGQDNFLTINPTNLLGGHHDYLKPKHSKIKAITIDGSGIVYSNFDRTIPTNQEEVVKMLEDLPSGFTKDYDFGLGLAKEYWHIIHAIEELSDCEEIVISNKEKTKIDENFSIFMISWNDFENARRGLNSISDLGQIATSTVKETTVYTLFCQRLGRPLKDIKFGRHPVRRLITSVAQGTVPIGDKEQEEVLKAITDSAKTLGKEKPEKLAKLQNDIELLSLDLLIKHYEKMMAQSLEESAWQTFFNDNPFILNFAFGYPIVKIHGQASMGGLKLSGPGNKIADFLVKHRLTNNMAIFEIKKPNSKILNKEEYREGVYTPSSELSGAITQVLDQKYNLQREFASLVTNSRTYDIESYSVHCCLLIGTTPDGDNKKKSFELFRRNSKDVEIVTFDELLGKIRQLKEFLSGSKEAGN